MVVHARSRQTLSKGGVLKDLLLIWGVQLIEVSSERGAIDVEHFGHGREEVPQIAPPPSSHFLSQNLRILNKYRLQTNRDYEYRLQTYSEETKGGNEWKSK